MKVRSQPSSGQVNRFDCEQPFLLTPAECSRGREARRGLGAALDVEGCDEAPYVGSVGGLA